MDLLDELLLGAGAFYLLDHACIDYRCLYQFTQALVFFVTRAHINTRYRRCGGLPVDRVTGARSEQTIRLTGPKSSLPYTAPLLRIHYVSTEKDLRSLFLTKNSQLQAPTIAQLYRARWQAELLFRWIKQHVRIRAFYSTSAHAVETQAWVAVTVYFLGAILVKTTPHGPQPVQNLANSQRQ